MNYELRMKENIIQKKSYSFALKIIKLYKGLVEKKKEYVLSKQILRCGTSIGSNKEARETKYWLSLLRDTKYISNDIAEFLINDCEEICRIIAKIQKTSKQNFSNS